MIKYKGIIKLFVIALSLIDIRLQPILTVENFEVLKSLFWLHFKSKKKGNV